MRFGALTLSWVLSIALVASAPTTASPARPDVRIWRLDCGQLVANDAEPFSDTGLYGGKSLRLSDGCYLIRHGGDLLLWDAGVPASLLGASITEDPVSPTLSVDLPSQLAKLGLHASEIKWLAISHYHWDHVGQAAAFPGATLLIGASDWAALNSREVPFGADPKLLDHWLTAGGKVEPLQGDHDVFGDGTVMILSAPGHTPGSLALLVRLARSGPVILSGDVLISDAPRTRSAVPTWNTSRAESLASMERLQGMARNLGATIIVQHDPADISKLARFPGSTR